MVNTTRIGQAAETWTRQWLEAKGWRCLEQNARTRFFELDLVMEDGETIVFVEVKYRQSSKYGGGAGAISRDKQRRLVAGAQVWLAEQKLLDRAVRFDVMDVGGDAAELRVVHLRDCLWEEYVW